MSNSLNYYFGIDFGTTSCATVGFVVMDNKSEVISYGDDEGRPIPSAVAIEKNTGIVFTGREAWEKKMELSESCEYITSIKSILDSDWKKLIAGKQWTPEDVACEVFKALKKNIKERTGGILDKAVVAIPIGFSAAKREKLREAAMMADIKIKSFISEPTAAFFANYKELKSSKNVAIFDWGGGTLDVSILQNSEGKIFELATTGMSVAGDDLDKRIAERIHAKISRKKKIAIVFEDMPASAQDLLLVKSERAKRALGDDDTATISINNYGAYGAFRETIDYEWFADIINPEIELAISCLEEAIHESGVGLGNIDRIVMVGGSSNLSPLLEKMDVKFGDKLFFPEETMWNVGYGAAQLSMNPGGYYANQSIGIVLSDGGDFELLKPHTLLSNWHDDFNFGLVDTSKEARFVFCGSPDINKSTEKYKSISVPAYRFLQEKILLHVEVDHDLIFKAMAKSNMHAKEYSRFWDYAKLKCYYKLPE